MKNDIESNNSIIRNKKIIITSTITKPSASWEKKKIILDVFAGSSGAPPPLQLDIDRILATVCILCRRSFKSYESLVRHKQLSEMHKNNLEIAKAKVMKRMSPITLLNQKRINTNNDNDNTNTNNNTNLNHNINYEPVIVNKRKSKRQKFYHSSSSSNLSNKKNTNTTNNTTTNKNNKNVINTNTTTTTTNNHGKMMKNDASLSEQNNIGNRIMKKMGWKEGTGLGKDNSGMVAPVEVQLRSDRAGLGSLDEDKYAVKPGDSYQEATKKKARARFERLMTYTRR